MKILLALDTSPLACDTVTAIQRMLAPAGTSVVVLSVVGLQEPETIPSPVLLASVAQDLATLEADAVRTHEEVVARASRTLREAGFDATGEIGYGDPRLALDAAVRSHQPDLIVIGSHCHSAVRRLVMGSVATHAIGHSPCSVLVVRHEKN